MHGLCEMLLVQSLLDGVDEGGGVGGVLECGFEGVFVEDVADVLLNELNLMGEGLDGDEQIGAVDKILVFLGEGGPQVGGISLYFIPGC